MAAAEAAGAEAGVAAALFEAHVELLQFFLLHRGDIVERIQQRLNAQRQPNEVLRDASLLSDHFEDCFFAGPSGPGGYSRLRGQLENAHWAHGFKPRALPGLHNGLFDPAEMMVRAFHLWQQTRWPGRNGRVRYAHTLFNLYVIRCLALLSMRVWDVEVSSAGDRLVQVQGVLDQLWSTSPADQPGLVRDARWLIPLAQSPATDDLGAYFTVAERIAHTGSEADRIAIHDASVRTAAGHLRSQIRYYSLKNAVPLDESRLVLNTRSSNALDYALLIQDLVPLLDAYEHASHRGDVETRLDLADAICQGVSADPELFLNRVELLGAYSMIEHLFVTIDGSGNAAYTPMGQRHMQLLQQYAALLDRVSALLSEDCSHFVPVAGGYSPYGVLYGFASDLVEHIAFKTLQPDAAPDFGLEDVFVAGDARKLAWVSGWRKLPHLAAEVIKQFEYAQPFAEAIFGRIEQAWRRRASAGAAVARTGRLCFLSGDDPDAHAAVSYNEAQLLSDRREGRCLLSYQTPGGWVAISKTILTEELGAGRDARIVGLPPIAVGMLTLLCPGLVVSGA